MFETDRNRSGQVTCSGDTATPYTLFTRLFSQRTVFRQIKIDRTRPTQIAVCRLVCISRFPASQTDKLQLPAFSPQPRS